LAVDSVVVEVKLYLVVEPRVSLVVVARVSMVVEVPLIAEVPVYLYMDVAGVEGVVIPLDLLYFCAIEI
jgi:hypothetical protein